MSLTLPVIGKPVPPVKAEESAARLTIRSGAVYLGDEQLKTYQPANGPPMIEDSRINKGRPTSVFDALYKGKLTAAQHAVPVDRNYAADEFAVLEVVTRAQLHREAAEKAGRPLAVSLPTLTDIKKKFWSGEMTAKELATQHKAGVQTIYRIIHGVTAWYA